jgi:hypothetical protein
MGFYFLSPDGVLSPPAGGWLFLMLREGGGDILLSPVIDRSREPLNIVVFPPRTPGEMNRLASCGAPMPAKVRPLNLLKGSTRTILFVR